MTTTPDDDATLADVLAKYRRGELTDEEAEAVRGLLDKVAAMAAGWRRVDEYRRTLRGAGAGDLSKQDSSPATREPAAASRPQ
jgi:hypothetical protein